MPRGVTIEAPVAELELVDAYWRAANYLSVGQIYLLDNPLLREPLRIEHIKPRLLGHFGTSPGLNLVYAHMNRVIKTRRFERDIHCGTGSWRPGRRCQCVLEGTYTEKYPRITQAEEGLRALFRQFHFRAAFRATPRRTRRDRFTRAASWVTACCMRTAPCSTIPISSRAA